MRWMAITIIVLSMAVAHGPGPRRSSSGRSPPRHSPRPGRKLARHPAQRPVVSSPTTGEDKISVTHHFVKVNGIRMNYEAAAGTMMMKDEFGKPPPPISFLSHIRKSRSAKSADHVCLQRRAWRRRRLAASRGRRYQAN